MYVPITFATALAIGTVSAEYSGLIVFGSIQDAKGDAVELVKPALTNPTATRSIKFNPFEGVWSSLPENSRLVGSEWEWRVNVTDVPAPEADADGATTDSHIVVVTNDLSWPGGVSLAAALGGGSDQSPFCYTVFPPINVAVPGWGGPDFPINITNGYDQEQAESGSCGVVLGDECYQAILSEGASRAGIGSDGTCQSPQKDWDEISQCAGVFGYAASLGSDTNPGTSGVQLGTQGNATNATEPYPGWMSGEGFFAGISDPVNGSNSQQYLTATNQLQILMINSMFETESGGSQIGSPQLLCMRVNATELPDVDTDGDGVVLTSEAVIASSSGSHIHASCKGTVMLLMMVGLWTMRYF
ncbi:hypothetical protein F4778DRAFT_46401 [Xylariomycetidae sp. FL2044]|nr:hypothetical protein F4778DRAFT_46401 [Xylariomycetidae sp. FL2044]